MQHISNLLRSYSSSKTENSTWKLSENGCRNISDDERQHDVGDAPKPYRRRRRSPVEGPAVSVGSGTKSTRPAEPAISSAAAALVAGATVAEASVAAEPEAGSAGQLVGRRHRQCSRHLRRGKVRLPAAAVGCRQARLPATLRRR
jgi:hypothetical protein